MTTKCRHCYSEHELAYVEIIQMGRKARHLVYDCGNRRIFVPYQKDLDIPITKSKRVLREEQKLHNLQEKKAQIQLF